MQNKLEELTELKARVTALESQLGGTTSSEDSIALGVASRDLNGEPDLLIIKLGPSGHDIALEADEAMEVAAQITMLASKLHRRLEEAVN